MTDGAPSQAEWLDYFNKTAARPPRDTLLEALRFLPETSSHLAVDLGCGAGNDTRYLLEHDFKVWAFDAQAAAIERLTALNHPNLTACCTTFDVAHWPPADLIVAHFALPFCPPDVFLTVWAHIRTGLRPGGVFVGQFFGDRDEWGNRANMNFHTRAAAEARLEGLRVHAFREVEQPVGKLARGSTKHWHYFDIIASTPGD